MLLERRERLLPASSPESAVGSSEAGSYRSSFWLSALLRGEAQIVGGVLELAYYRAAGEGQAGRLTQQRALPGFRLSSWIIGRRFRVCLVI